MTAVGSYLNETKVNNIKLDVTYEFINMKAGTYISPEKIQEILKKLGFEIISHNSSLMTLKVPSWRASKDVSIKEDIAEEVIRIYGYDNIAVAPLGANSGISTRNTNRQLRDLSLNYWKSEKWNEVYNYSFTNTALDAAIGYSDMTDSVAIQNAFNVEYTHMRRSLSVRLFDNIAKNRNIQENLRFYEIGKVYSKEQSHTATVTELLQNIDIKPYGELPRIAGASTADTIESLRRSLESYLIETIGYVPPLHQSNSLPFLHPGVSGEYREGESVFISFGRVHPATAEAFDIPADTLYWEADIGLLLSHFELKETRVAPISRFQSIPRELSFVMDELVHTGPIALTIESHHPWISGVTVGSIYRDETRLGSGKKSVNFVFSLTSHEHTISDDEALKLQNEIIETMKQKGCEIHS